MPILLALLSMVSVGAYEVEFDAAIQSYQAQDYADAIRRFEQIAATGAADPVLFYNLGNAYFRQGDIAPAIANYERALQLDPRMADAESNLKYALAATQRNLARPLRPGWQESLLPWDDSFRIHEVRALALASWFIFWLLLLWRVVERRRFQVFAATVALLMAAAFMTSLYSKSYPQQLAVAAFNNVPVRTGANPADTLRFELFPGDRVHVETESNGWLRVATVDGERGWAEASQFVRVGPPYLTPPPAEPPEATP